MDFALEIAELLGSIAGLIDFLKGLFSDIGETVDVFVQGGTEIIGLADAVSEPIQVTKDFVGYIFPYDFVVMIGIGITIIMAVAMRRSANA